MGHPAEKLPPRATYADIEAAPENMIAEIIEGVLYTMPRPAPRHARTSSALGAKLGSGFDLGDGGPGGWWILDEPELHFPSPLALAKDEEDVLVPDLAGWRRERMPYFPEEAYFTLAPDWVCEVLSKGTMAVDRAKKMPIYAREGVEHAWLIDPVERTLEVFELGPSQRWVLLSAHSGNERVRAAPFEAMELDLSLLWAGTRA